jgi:hypothetical protein
MAVTSSARSMARRRWAGAGAMVARPFGLRRASMARERGALVERVAQV